MLTLRFPSDKPALHLSHSAALGHVHPPTNPNWKPENPKQGCGQSLRPTGSHLRADHCRWRCRPAKSPLRRWCMGSAAARFLCRSEGTPRCHLHTSWPEEPRPIQCSGGHCAISESIRFLAQYSHSLAGSVMSRWSSGAHFWRPSLFLQLYNSGRWLQMRQRKLLVRETGEGEV